MKHIFYLLAFLAQSCDAANKTFNVDEFRREIYDILSSEETAKEALDKESSKNFYRNIHTKQPAQQTETEWETLWQHATNHNMSGRLAKIISTTNEYSKNLQPKELSDALKEEIIAAAVPEGWGTIDITGISPEGICYKSASGCDCFMPTSGAYLSNLLLLYADFTL